MNDFILFPIHIKLKIILCNYSYNVKGDIIDVFILMTSKMMVNFYNLQNQDQVILKAISCFPEGKFNITCKYYICSKYVDNLTF